MDEIDFAADLAEAHRRISLAQHRPVRPISAAPQCLACGEDIPAARRQALPGCAWCVECAAEFEGTSRR